MKREKFIENAFEDNFTKPMKAKFNSIFFCSSICDGATDMIYTEKKLPVPKYYIELAFVLSVNNLLYNARRTFTLKEGTLSRQYTFHLYER